MSPSFEEALVRLAARVATLLREDEELREHVRTVVQSLASFAAPPAAVDRPGLEPAAGGGRGEQVVSAAPPAADAPQEVLEPAEAEAAEAGAPDYGEGIEEGVAAASVPSAVDARSATLVYSTGGPAQDSGPAALSRAVAYLHADAQTLRGIAVRCHLKAQATRWSIERMQLIRSRADYETEIRPRDNELREEAEAMTDCFLWMAGRFNPDPDSVEQWEVLAECFECVEAAATLLAEILGQGDEDSDTLEDAIMLAAEAQSALRTAVQRVGQGYDPTQVQFYKVLRQVTADRHIYVPRHMREDDPADPAQWDSIKGRIDALDEARNAHQQRLKRRRKLLGKVRYHAGKIGKAAGDANPADVTTLIEATEELINDGLQPSNPELREYLLPILDELPDYGDNRPAMDQVMRALDHYLSVTPGVTHAVPPREVTPEVAEVRRLLEGKKLALIGGEERLGAKQALEAQFGLDELIWLAAGHHQSVSDFRPYVQRDEVALVLLAIRWSSHGFRDVKPFCDDVGKPLVRLPSGYNPNQVARQILDQAANRLRSE